MSMILLIVLLTIKRIEIINRVLNLGGLDKTKPFLVYIAPRLDETLI